MNKVFLINKPVNMTSQSCVYKIKKKFNESKVGHAGTLDPFANGLMLVLVGEATKLSDFLMNHKKSYVAKLKLGEYTESFDTEKPVSKVVPVPNLSKEDIDKVLDKFKGNIKQVPPVFSALKINGRKACDIIRNGENVEMKERDVTIYDIKLISYKDNILEFYVECSKGTYIRTLGVDIAESLGTLGHLIALERQTINEFNLKDSKTIEDVNESDGYDIKDVLNIKHIYVDEQTKIDVKNGKKVELDCDDELVLLIHNNVELAIYIKESAKIYKCYRGFNL